jgi:ribosomal-protein-alanine N-acetyltransferase
LNAAYSLLLHTARLDLVACTLELSLLELQSTKALAAALQVGVPSTWPPPLNDESSQRWFLDKLQSEPGIVGWTMWYFVLRSGGPRELVGNGGFKGRPQRGLVEIGYSILPEHQRKGYATEATLALITWAFSHPEVDRVAAETLPELEPSLAVMRKCGMKCVRSGRQEEGMQTVHYEIGRDEWIMLRSADPSS